MSTFLLQEQLGTKTGFLSSGAFMRKSGHCTHLHKMHASVEADGRHGACVVVWHAHGLVPLTAVSIEQQPDASPDNLVDGRDLLHVHCELEGDVSQQ